MNLPGAATGQPQERAESATVSIDAAGKVFFNKQLVDQTRLDTALRDLLARNRDARVFINGDARAEFGKAVALLDTVRRLGISKVAIETRLAPVANGPEPIKAP